MNDFLKFIENKIKKNIKVESILIKDNSYLHKKHKFFDSEKYHLKLEIESSYLNALNKIKAHRGSPTSVLRDILFYKKTTGINIVRDY